MDNHATIQTLFELFDNLQEIYRINKDREQDSYSDYVKEYYAGICDGISRATGMILDTVSDLLEQQEDTKDFDEFCA